MSDKSLENDTYKLTKNGDSLILTNKKTQKTRVLEIDDANYVFDDYNHFRDSNIIENYFKLKEEQYTPPLQTKTADYVKEYKEAENLYTKKYEDIIERFIKKFNLSLDEIEKLSKIPDDNSIKKFNRSEEEKKEIINSFKVMKKELKEDKKIETDPFTYLKSYFKDYYETKKVIDFVNVSINDFIKNKEKYTTEEDYEKIKNKKIESLDDLANLGIKQFSNINLVKLTNYITKLAMICKRVESSNNNPISLKNINQPEFINSKLKYWWCITMNPQDGGITGGEKKEYTSLTDNNVSNEKILFCLSIISFLLTTFYKTISKIYEEELESHKTITDLIYSLCENGLKYFDSSVKISILENIYNNFTQEKIYDFYPRLYVNPNIEKNVSFINFTVYKEDCPYISLLGDVYTKTLKADNNTLKYPDITTAYNKIKDIFDYCKRKLTGMGNQQSSGWTDTTLTRIENIKDVLKDYSSGVINQSSGWTDTTLTRIENIKDILNGYNSGMVSPSLLRVMSKTKSSGSNSSSGWTDTTLTRIERINETLHNYI